MTEAAENQVQVITNPDTFISQAIESKADITVLTGLFDLKQRWEGSEAKKAFHVAMAQFQEIKPDLRKSSQVKFTTTKGTTEYNFCPSLPSSRTLSHR